MSLYKVICFENEQEYIDMFLSLPSAVYKGDKNYIPERKSEIVALLHGENPCKAFLKQKNLLVLNGKTPVCRGIAFVNKINNTGSIGAFECLNAQDAVKALVDEAKNFFKEHNISEAYAPMNGSIWSSYRLMTKGFEDKPFYGEPYNKEYYYDLLAGCGFTTVKKWETQLIKKLKAKNSQAKRYENLEKSAHGKGIKVRSLKDFDEDIRIIHKLAMNSFSEFYLFHEIDVDTFAQLYNDLRYIANADMIKIAYRGDEPVGFGIALPDYGDMFRSFNAIKNKLNFKSKIQQESAEDCKLSAADVVSKGINRLRSGYLMTHIIFKRYKRCIFLYLGTKQKNGESVYPQSSKAIMFPILKYLYLRRKSLICAMMSENAKTRNFSQAYDSIHEYTLLGMEIK